MPDRRSGLTPGTVLRASGGSYEVLLDDQTLIQATLRGRLKAATSGRGASGRRVRETIARTGDRVVAGDRVRIAVLPDGSYTIEFVDDRRTELARRAPGRNQHRAKVLVANVDQIAIVFAVTRPDPHLRMLDRFLVLAEANHLDALIVANKCDLATKSEVEALFAAYPAAGYTVLYTSVLSGEGVDALRDALCHNESVLTGPSGVGKSSLLNAIEPGLELSVGDVSIAVGKGRHTTVTAALIPLACGGFVADTPGLREVGLWDIDRDELDGYFPEFRPLLGTCRFGSSCTHAHEPDCAIRDAVENHTINRHRFESYIALLGDDRMR
ncbi:MAG: ribosome small subunit-dependent GTPase A [Longimicrobiales bacterium]